MGIDRGCRIGLKVRKDDCGASAEGCVVPEKREKAEPAMEEALEAQSTHGRKAGTDN